MNDNLARLQVLEAGKIIQEVPITKRDLLIGREPGNDIVINHPQVSRQQARLKYNGRNWVLENLSPNNPVKVALSNSGQPLNNGEQFMLGPLTVTLVLANSQGQLVAPPPLEARPTSMLGQASPIPSTMILTDKDRDGQEDHGYGAMVASPVEASLRVEYEGTVREYTLSDPRVTI